MDITINKIRIKEKFTEVEYVTYQKTEDEELISSNFKCRSNAKPHKDLFNAFQKLKKHAANICELSVFNNDKKSEAANVVTSVRLMEDIDSSRVMISMNKYIKSGKCYSVTTPLIDLGKDEYEHMNELTSDIEKLKEEAEKFVKGKNGNQQIELDFHPHVKVA